MKIIGFLGKTRSGKSTGSDYLISKYQYTEVAFADPLKKACQLLFLFSDEQLYGTSGEKEASDPRWFDCSPRTAMQYIGTNLLRDQLEQIMPGLGKNMFVHHFKLWYEVNTDKCIVISDVRFHNEAECIKQLGGTIIKVERKNLESDNTHISETEQDEIPFDHFISNESTLAEYYDMIDQILTNN